ncbi:MAG: hypothetical protein ACXVCE_17330, partial [Bacteriovorax sp.]
SQKLLEDFENHFGTLETEDDVMALAHLITHVSGEHLGKWKEGQLLLNALKSNSLLKDHSGIDRLMASLSLGEDLHFSIDHFSGSDQVRILGMTASALASLNDAKRAGDYLKLANAMAEAKLPKIDPANRALAVAGNNLACALEEKEMCTQEEVNLMIQAALIGRKYWEIAGTWMEVERAEYRLAKTFMKAQFLDKAHEHAEKCLAIVALNNNDPLETFFGLEALALVEKARNNKSAFDGALEKMNEVFNKLSLEDQSWCKETLEKMAL